MGSVKRLYNYLLNRIVRFKDSKWNSKKTPLENAGELIQFVNPTLVGLKAFSDATGISFLLHLATTLLIVRISKALGQKFKWGFAQRPDQGSFKGMPSTHTAAAWVGAAYSRQNIDNQPVVVLMYTGALLTAYSRVQSRSHTIAQVVGAAMLTEGVIQVGAYLSNSTVIRPSPT